MARKLLGSALTGLLLVAGSAAAMAGPSVFLNDTYVGGNDHGYGDIIGSAAQFNIKSATASRAGSMLSVAITTNYNGADGASPALLDFGDLFIAKTWTPFAGADPTGHKFDTYANGTQWQFAVHADGLTAASGLVTTAQSGSATIYAISQPSNVILSHVDDPNPSCRVIGHCWIWRDGQAVQVATADGSGPDVIQSGPDKGLTAAHDAAAAFSVNASWTYAPGAGGLDNVLTYTFDGTGMDVLIDAAQWDMAMSWAMTCGNDVIQGEIGRVPEPATLALLLAPLAGLGFLRRRKAA